MPKSDSASPRQTRDTLSRYAHMTTLAQALTRPALSGKLLWVVVEDAAETDFAINDLLDTSEVDYHYLAAQSPPDSEHRGLVQRNAALDWIASSGVEGVIYFADDDNAYRPTVWPGLRRLPITSYTILPVGNVGYFGWEGPIWSETADGKSRIEQWTCDFCPRRWNVDMSGFAFGTEVLRQIPNLRFDSSSRPGFLETDLLQQIERGYADLKLIPELTEVVQVWHNLGTPFRGAAFYDASWTTAGTVGRKMQNETDIVLGFSWSDTDLPLATRI